MKWKKYVLLNPVGSSKYQVLYKKKKDINSDGVFHKKPSGANTPPPPTHTKIQIKGG